MKGKYKDWADDMSPEELTEIEQGFADIENGNVFPNEEVMKIFDKYREKP